MDCKWIAFCPTASGPPKRSGRSSATGPNRVNADDLAQQEKTARNSLSRTAAGPVCGLSRPTAAKTRIYFAAAPLAINSWSEASFRASSAALRRLRAMVAQ